MQVFVAKQPIYDIQNNIVAYELLFRSGNNNFYDSLDGTAATIDVIYNSFYTIGIDNITDGKKAFINLTEELIKQEVITLLPPEVVSIEILEDIEPTDELIFYCKTLKEKGYSIVLDDFVFNEKYRELITLADIIKIDFRATCEDERRDVIKRINSNKVRFLAEKVETIEEIDEAKALGYTYFQGYYYGKPEIISAKDIPATKNSTMELMNQLKDNEMAIEIVEKSIIKDVSMLYKLLKFMNSSMLGITTEISSVEYAVKTLGKERFLKWLDVVLRANSQRTQEDTAVNQILLRAQFAHNICLGIGRTEDAFKAYIMGMVSKMYTLLEYSTEHIIKELDLYEDICAALKGEENYLNYILNVVEAYENQDWNRVRSYCKKLNVACDIVTKAYLDSMKWIESV